MLAPAAAMTPREREDEMRKTVEMAMAGLTALALAACGGGAEPTATPSGNASVAVDLGEWHVTAVPASAPAGEIDFDATNSGNIEHELVIVKTDLAHDALVVVDGKVDEAASGTLIGEIEPDELPAGGEASATFNLAAGNYALICNLPGHYGAGMHTGFTVN
jgi:uncharacterized cupredoxin-like copper-binding protein